MEKLKYYIVDSSLRKNNQSPVYIYDTIPQLVTHLEQTCLRSFKKTRAKLMESAADTGLIEDDKQGRAFYELMTEYFNIGYLRGNTPVQKNIFEAEYISTRREEMGD
jgi:hypothetical protein